MALSFNFYSLLPIIASFFSICLSVLSVIEAGNGGFSVDFIHRDSSLSPFYNPSETPAHRLNNALRRSFNRIDHFMSSSFSPNSPQSTVIGNRGEYLMKVSIGTPPVPVLGIADTGSDLIWTQCKPCDICYKQIPPLFDPTKSSSYKNLACTSKFCNYLDSSQCVGSCRYRYRYGDQSHTYGNLAAEKLTLGSTTGRPVSLTNIAFGCGHNNDGTFDQNGSGLIGLGGGPLSLISQMGPSINGKFSYCLVPLGSNSTSKLNFGSNAVVSGRGVVSTPIIQSDHVTFFYLSLEGFSVGNKRLRSSAWNAKARSGQPNIIIDSGTTLTFVPSSLYDDLETEVQNAIDLEPISDPQGVLNLCYRTQSDIDVPVITAHFTGAEVKLLPLNTFVRVEDDVVCFSMVSASGDLAIFGNLAQMNFLVGYDLVNKKVSFKPTDCTKQ